MLNKVKIEIFIVMVATLIIIGFTLSFKLIWVIKKEPEEILINMEEKKNLIDMQNNKERDFNAFEKEYSDKLKTIKEKPEKQQNKDDIGKLYYILGFNSCLNNDRYKAIEYYNQCVNYLEGGTNYFYLLNVYNDLMNIHLSNSNSIEAFKQATNIYVLFQRTNIEGISEHGQEYIKFNVLSGLLATTSDYGMKSVSDKFYKELLELTESADSNKYNRSIYAKYRYNLNNGNYDKAKEYALEYISFFEDYTDYQKGGAYIYLLETLVYDKEFKDAEKIFPIVDKAYKEINDPMLFAYLDKIKGIYYEGLGEYEIALTYLDKSIKDFEALELYNYSSDVNKIIIMMNDKIDINLDRYITSEIEYQKNYDYIEELGKLADSLVLLSFEKNEEETMRMSNQIKVYNDINTISKKLNIIYIIVIVFLLAIARKLKNEIEKRKLKENELKKIVEIDYLTKAYTKQYAYKQVSKFIKDEIEFSIIIIDLDNFKIINDKYGHLFGDEVLVNIVDAIKKEIKKDGFIGRFGGEEFIIVYENLIDSKSIPEKLRLVIENIKWTKEDFKVTVSGGMIMCKNQYKDIDSLIYNADMLLYKAKLEGKDKIIIEE